VISDRFSRSRPAAEAAARDRGWRLVVFEIEKEEDIEAAFKGAMAAHAGGALVGAPGFLLSRERRVAELAARSRLPAVYVARPYVEAGGLMSYGADIRELYRAAAGFVDKILRGARPADLPVEQPTKFELVMNLKAAKALGLTIPPTLRSRVDEVIE
jgi:putative tryptophan/tyrosine transport system substrate-binding protein